MTPADDREFIRLMVMLTEVFGGELTPGKSDAYFRALTDYEIEYVDMAVHEYIKVGDFFPKPSHLRELAALYRGEARKREGARRPELTSGEPLTKEEAKQFIDEVFRRLNAPPEA